MFITMNELQQEIQTHAVFGYCEALPAAPVCIQPVKKPYKKEEKKETPMNNERYYLADRACEEALKFDRGLRAQYFIDNMKSPETAAELVARIQAGQYILPAEKNDFGARSIVWRDPANPADTAGYDSVMKAMTAAKQTAMDIIQTQDSAAGLAALNAFIAWTPTPTTATTN